MSARAFVHVKAKHKYVDEIDPRCNGNYPGEWSRGPLWACNGLEYSMCRDKSDLVCKLSDHFCQEGADGNYTKNCNDGSTCVHRDLWCDGFKHCTDGSDENPADCKTCKTGGFPPGLKEGSDLIPCEHRYNPGKIICAVLCDGIDGLCLGNLG